MFVRIEIPAENIRNSDRNTLVENFSARTYRETVICPFWGVNLLLVSIVFENIFDTGLGVQSTILSFFNSKITLPRIL